MEYMPAITSNNIVCFACRGTSSRNCAVVRRVAGSFGEQELENWVRVVEHVDAADLLRQMSRAAVRS